MDSSEPVPIKELRGHVARGVYGKGTKSEREAIFLETGSERYILRRKTGPAYADKQLDRYVGRAVICSGFLLGTTFLADEISAVE